ncbi:MAG: hypothetical protein ACFE8P_08545, partial [Promethearchaeota archaeon]
MSYYKKKVLFFILALVLLLSMIYTISGFLPHYWLEDPEGVRNPLTQVLNIVFGFCFFFLSVWLNYYVNKYKKRLFRDRLRKISKNCALALVLCFYSFFISFLEFYFWSSENLETPIQPILYYGGFFLG